MRTDRIGGITYAFLYFVALSLFCAYFASGIITKMQVPAEVAIAAGLVAIVASVLLLIYTPLLSVCVFVAVGGVAIDVAGLNGTPFGAVRTWCYVAVYLMLAGIIVLTNIKGHSQLRRRRVRLRSEGF